MSRIYKGIRDRLGLTAKKSRMAVCTLAMVLLIAVLTMGCTFTGPKIERTAKPTSVPSPDVDALIIEFLNSDGAYAEGAQYALTDSLIKHPVETLEAIGTRTEGIQAWLCWGVAYEIKGMALDTIDALSGEGLSENGRYACDLILKYISEDAPAPKSWRQVYLDFWTEEVPGLFEGIELDGVGFIDFDADGVPELLALQKDGSAVAHYTDGEQVYHNLGNVYDTDTLDFDGNILSLSAGDTLDRESVNALLNSWRPVD